MVYLSLGSISCSVGISSLHRSRAFSFTPWLANAVWTVEMTSSTARNLFLCRAFWNLDRRHGIFL
jgi:hypothetical protein